MTAAGSNPPWPPPDPDRDLPGGPDWLGLGFALLLLAVLAWRRLPDLQAGRVPSLSGWRWSAPVEVHRIAPPAAPRSPAL